MKQVKIYTSQSCGYCTQAKEFFKENGIEYTEIDAKSEPGKSELLELGFNVVPILVIGNDTIRGFQKEIVAHALGINA